ncbi:pimeloyl-ACP methyl ester carboxylesterase [Neorhizobium galegae]|uniref:alpha/beta fold hydrolase n=1 Tax=Neorhizobium galegae TaxID=399 RepID=UPI001AE2FF2D|nr:alpha/beta hydrolase [Neorhizobium galegae]MBP2562563.1 pimeloyl-ACP methyl ester carboxylesterase [Neorhizobium galegae]
MIFEWEGETLYYAVEGDGPALVLLHGLGGKADNWLLQRRHLSASHKVLSLDLPGHGSSTGRSMHFTDYWRAVDAMLNHAGVAQSAICGLSAGARVGLDFAARSSQRTTGLVIINAFVHMEPEDRLSRLAMYDLLTKENGAKLWAEQLLSLMGMEGHGAITRGFLKSVEAVDPLHIRRIFREQEEYDQRPQLKSLECPLLVVRGEKDDLVPGYCSDDILRQSKNGELVVLDAGHLPYLETPTDFNRQLSKFLSRN